MKKIKAFAVYGIIIILCVGAFAGYLLQKSSKSTSAIGYINKSESEKKAHIESLLKAASVAPSGDPVVGVGRGKKYAEVTKKAIENAGGLKDIIKKGSVVLIKPNICITTGEPDMPQITNYRVVREVVDEAYECGASKVIIAEGCINGDNVFSAENLKSSGYGTIKKVEFVNINGLKKEDCYELKPKKSLTGKALLIPKVYMDADVVIGVAKLKTHQVDDAVVTLSLKNSVGLVPSPLYGTAYRSGLHDLGLKEAIVDLNRIRRPDFAIIDGIIGGEGLGPVEVSPVESDVVFAGRDLVALDTVGLTFMGFNVDIVPHVKLAASEKLGTSDLKKIKVAGADLNSIKMDFESIYKLSVE